jgi:transposase
MQLVFLPAYSPDLNVIEEAFSAIKAWIWANWDYARSELSGEVTCNPYKLLWDAVFEAVTPAKAAGWFHNSGYL